MNKKQVVELVDSLKIEWSPGVEDIFIVEGRVWPRAAVEALLRQNSVARIRVRAGESETISEMDALLLWIRRNRIYGEMKHEFTTSWRVVLPLILRNMCQGDYSAADLARFFGIASLRLIDSMIESPPKGFDRRITRRRTRSGFIYTLG